MPVDAVSAAGLPEQTREDAGQYTRFTNMSAIFVEPQSGEWIVQLVDASGLPMGPAALFTLTVDEETRELYVRYRQK